jgi:ribonuclease P protein component
VLPRERRLRAGRDWDALFKRGFSVSGPLISLRIAPTPGQRRVGFSVGKKVGSAVVRNLVKRRLRAIAAERWDSLPEAEIGVLARPMAATAGYVELEAAFRELAIRAEKRIGPETP